MTKAEVKRKARDKYPGCTYNHVYPRAYCVCRQRSWAVFAVPNIDAEEQVRPAAFVEVSELHPGGLEDIQTSDWAALAYIYSKARQCGGMAVVEKL